LIRPEYAEALVRVTLPTALCSGDRLATPPDLEVKLEGESHDALR